MPPGGARPGAGHPPTNLNVPIDFDGTGRAVTITERVVETLRAGAFVKDAAARIGFPVETLREWQKVGQRAIRDVVQGNKRNRDLSFHERQCAVLAQAMTKAEAECRLMMLGDLNKLARGVQRTETTTRMNAQGQPVETSTRVVTSVPDGRSIQWFLERRHPEDFGRQRIELSGPEGGPIELGLAASAADKVRALIAEVRTARADTEDSQLYPDPAPAAAGGNGNGTSNGGHA